MSLKLHRSSRILRAATHGRGMWDLIVPLSTPSPVPTASATSPASVFVRGPAFALIVNGTDFVAGSIVRWNGSDRPTTFISDTQLSASISASALTVVGAAQVTVFTGPPGGGTSNILTFPVNAAPAPTLSSLSPTSA